MKTFLTLSLIILVAAAAGAAFAVAPQPEAVAAPAGPVAGGPQAVPPPISPMIAEIEAAQTAARAQVAALTERCRAATDDATALEFQREISRVKREARLESLRIQLRWARTEGREAAVAELEGVLERMTAPPVVGEPVRRDPPAPASRR